MRMRCITGRWSDVQKHYNKFLVIYNPKVNAAKLTLKLRAITELDISTQTIRENIQNIPHTPRLSIFNSNIMTDTVSKAFFLKVTYLEHCQVFFKQR